MIKAWRDAWDDFVPFLEFPVELRQIVYTTNSIESLNARFRKAAVRRGHFPTEDAALKVLYLTAIERRKNRTNPTGRINGWKAILHALDIHYHGRSRRRCRVRPGALQDPGTTARSGGTSAPTA